VTGRIKVLLIVWNQCDMGSYNVVYGRGIGDTECMVYIQISLLNDVSKVM